MTKKRKAIFFKLMCNYSWALARYFLIASFTYHFMHHLFASYVLAHLDSFCIKYYEITKVVSSLKKSETDHLHIH